MARRAALLGISLLMTVAACADAGKVGVPGASGTPTWDPATAFEARAERVAQAWRDAAGESAWRTGFVPLQDLTVPPADVTFSEATKQAFTAGWYRLDVGMPREAGGREGTIRYADGGSATVPIVTLGQAYAELDQGDPPACPGPSVPPPADAPGADSPDGPVSDGAPKPCATLTVTSITLGTVTVPTSRGEATVPAWLFTVPELKGQVARVAVAPSAISAVPEVAAGTMPPVDGLVAAQDLTDIDGTTLAYRLGIGACDENIVPQWFETDEVVVVAGTVTRREGNCTDQLLIHPVRITLDEAVGSRPVLDAVTGQVLTLVVVP